MRPEQIVIHGKDYEIPGDIHCVLSHNGIVGLGISVGTHQKDNEDSIGVLLFGEEMVLSVADGHWGREASELAVAKAANFINSQNRPAKGHEARARLYALFEQINTALYNNAMSGVGSPAPETTLIVSYIKVINGQRYLYWASFGDSYLLVIREGKLLQLNSLQAHWLGVLSKMSEYSRSGDISLEYSSGITKYVNVASGLETGIEQLQRDDVIILCTDGLIGSDNGISDDVKTQLVGIFSTNKPLDAQVKEIISYALHRGEDDNIACVATRVH